MSHFPRVSFVRTQWNRNFITSLKGCNLKEFSVQDDVIGRYAAIDVVGCTERSPVFARYSPIWESQSGGMIGHHEAM